MDYNVHLPCGCEIAWNHGEWDPDFSVFCGGHTWRDWDQLVRLASRS